MDKLDKAFEELEVSMCISISSLSVDNGVLIPFDLHKKIYSSFAEVVKEELRQIDFAIRLYKENKK